MNAARRHLVAVERILCRLQPPVLDGVGAEQDRLTVRERQVLVMLSDGLLARSIAQRLDVSERTVHKHLGNVYRKLDVHDRLLAVRRGEALGLSGRLPGRPRLSRWQVVVLPIADEAAVPSLAV